MNPLSALLVGLVLTLAAHLLAKYGRAEKKKHTAHRCNSMGSLRPTLISSRLAP